MSKNKPNLLIIPFNRPHYLQQVLARTPLKDYQAIYCFIDGPRNKADEEQIAEVKKLLKAHGITRLNAQSKNLGINAAFETAITWFFSEVESGIILEEDCIPDPTFAAFANRMLELYQSDKTVGMITGYNSLPDNSNDYFFSHQFGIWGWASWRDRWQDYTRISTPPDIKVGFLDLWRYTGSVAGALTLYTKFQRQLFKHRAFWDINWVYTNAVHHRVCIMPSTNLITNIGHLGNSSAGQTRFHDNLTQPLDVRAFTEPKPVVVNNSYDQQIDFRFNFLPAIKTFVFQLAARLNLIRA